ncbi:MAG: hypothetical protein KME35_03590 [Aphanocapsa sp. GSE-SYN-MK-11-07L]|jgi:hypothetical protein|nr:hypothetical protein [Aphanocapsa sp. GSE-SYN-MK-11-07L]
MTQAIDEPNQFQQLIESQRLVLERLDKIDQDLRETNTKFDAYVKASDRLLGVATTIIITAGTVTILAPLAQSVAPTIRAFLGGSA